MKKVMMIALGLCMLLTLGAQARDRSRLYIPVSVMKTGDYLTNIVDADPTDDSSPWFADDLNSTVVVIPDVTGDTASAVTFDFIVPNNYQDQGELFAIVKPAASDTTVKLRADVVVQGVVESSPTTITAQTNGVESTVLTAADLDNLTFLKLANTGLNNLTAGQKINVYVGRTSGTGENLFIHGIFFLYRNQIYRFR